MFIDHIWRAWYNRSDIMAADPIKTLELHYTMIQFFLFKRGESILAKIVTHNTWKLQTFRNSPRATESPVKNAHVYRIICRFGLFVKYKKGVHFYSKYIKKCHLGKNYYIWGACTPSAPVEHHAKQIW